MRGRFASRASQRLVGALIAMLLISSSPAVRPALAAAQPHIGYERWTGPDVASGVDFGLMVTEVFQDYAGSFALGGLPAHPQKNKRLIDIEVRDDDGGGVANYVYDVVWVENEGDFLLESWFVPWLTEDELHLLPQLAPQQIVAVDVERHPKGNEWRYSVILQRNAEKVGWEVLTDASLDDVLDTAERDGMRVLDLDHSDNVPDCRDVPQGQACSKATFDAILVGNQGSHAVETDVHLNMSPALIDQKESQGWQVIDREGDATVWVQPGLPFEIVKNLSQNGVEDEHDHEGRVVDLEGSPGNYSIVRFGSSPAPAAPGLADAQQDGNDDGRPGARQRDGKAKGKSERDGKAKEHKPGKRGKHGKGRGR